jgi:glutaredoxin 3
MPIKIYSTPTCPYCRMTKTFLDELKVTYEDIDISASEQAAAEMVQRSGQMGVPVLDINGKIILGFDKDAITAALRT